MERSDPRPVGAVERRHPLRAWGRWPWRVRASRSCRRNNPPAATPLRSSYSTYPVAPFLLLAAEQPAKEAYGELEHEPCDSEQHGGEYDQEQDPPRTPNPSPRGRLLRGRGSRRGIWAAAVGWPQFRQKRSPGPNSWPQFLQYLSSATMPSPSICPAYVVHGFDHEPRPISVLCMYAAHGSARMVKNSIPPGSLDPGAI